MKPLQTIMSPSKGVPNTIRFQVPKLKNAITVSNQESPLNGTSRQPILSPHLHTQNNQHASPIGRPLDTSSLSSYRAQNSQSLLLKNQSE